MRFDVIYEDNHLIAVNKPAGVLVQRDATTDMSMSDLVKKYIKKKYDKPGDVFLGTIHRIDRPVSGVTIYARTSKALSRMNELWRTKQVKKTYIALSHKNPENFSGTLVHYISKNEQKNKVNVYDKVRNGAKKSETKYELLSRINNVFAFKVEPITGRSHQIRAQFSRMGCPLVGDLKYGASEALNDKSVGLHAYSIEFVHPVKKEEIKITAPPIKRPPWNFFDFTDKSFLD